MFFFEPRLDRREMLWQRKIVSPKGKFKSRKLTEKEEYMSLVRGTNLRSQSQHLGICPLKVCQVTCCLKSKMNF